MLPWLPWWHCSHCSSTIHQQMEYAYAFGGECGLVEGRTCCVSWVGATLAAGLVHAQGQKAPASLNRRSLAHSPMTTWGPSGAPCSMAGAVGRGSCAAGVGEGPLEKYGCDSACGRGGGGACTCTAVAQEGRQLATLRHTSPCTSSARAVPFHYAQPACTFCIMCHAPCAPAAR